MNMEDALVNEQMQSFEPTNSIQQLRNTLFDIAKTLNFSAPPGSYAYHIAFYLQAYLNGYDFEKIFIMNLSHTLEDSFYQQVVLPRGGSFSLEDKTFGKTMFQLLTKNPCDIAAIIDCVNHYNRSAQPSDFKKRFMLHFQDYSTARSGDGYWAMHIIILGAVKFS